MILDDSKKNEFVALFPANRKSNICNKILDQIRSGELNTSKVARKVVEKLNRYPDDNGDILFILAMNQKLFMDAIDYYVEYENLPYGEKMKLKIAKNSEYVAHHMDKQPATEKQIYLLKQKGYEGPFNLSKLEASRKIDELLRQ